MKSASPAPTAMAKEDCEKGYHSSKLRKLKERITKVKYRVSEKFKKKSRYKGHGTLKVVWTQDELPIIVKAICKKYPGLTYLTVERNYISWNFELDKQDIIPVRKVRLPNLNPSKRDDTVENNRSRRNRRG